MHARMNAEPPSFSSPQEEIDYWKDLAHEYKKSYDDTKEELEEFQVSSHDLETELEAQLEQCEGRVKDLSSNNNRLNIEVESLREKLEVLQASSHRQITELQDELAQVRAYKDELAKYIREIEQVNDDLERTKRATVVSLEDFEARLNLAIERNAFLESELEEREALDVTVQRLKDEARDLRQELAVRQPSVVKKDKLEKIEGELKALSPETETKPLPQELSKILDSNKVMDGDFVTPSSTPSKAHIHNNQSGGNPLTPSARISALNIVGDLLRKVGALESKLATCRNYVKEQPSRLNKTGASPLNSPRAKRAYTGSAISQGSNGTPNQQAYVKIEV